MAAKLAENGRKPRATPEALARETTARKLCMLCAARGTEEPSWTRRGGANETHQRQKAATTLMHLTPLH